MIRHYFKITLYGSMVRMDFSGPDHATAGFLIWWRIHLRQFEDIKFL